MPLFSQKLLELLKLKELLRFMENYTTTDANTDAVFTTTLPHQEYTGAIPNSNDVTQAQTDDVIGTPMRETKKSEHKRHKRSVSDTKELNYRSNEVFMLISALNELIFESDALEEEGADHFRNINEVLRYLNPDNNTEKSSRSSNFDGENSVTRSSARSDDERHHKSLRGVKSGDTFSKSTKRGKRLTDETEYVMEDGRSFTELIASTDERKRRKRRLVETSFKIRDMKRSLSHLLSKANSEKSKHLKRHKNVFDKIKHLKDKVISLPICFNIHRILIISGRHQMLLLSENLLFQNRIVTPK